MSASQPSSDGGSTEVSHEELERIQATLRSAVRNYRPVWLRDEGDDLVQKALMRVLRQSREGNPAFSSSYLWKTAYSVVVDQIRHEGRKRETALELAPGVTHTTAQVHSPEVTYRSTELREALDQAIRALSHDRRVAVTLFLQGHTVRECSVLLGWDYKRTENLVYRAYKDLRDFLGERGFQP